MSFLLYLIFIALSFLRPMEVIVPESVVYRPMALLGFICLLASIVGWITSQKIEGRKLYFILLFVFLGCIALSKITNGWTGGAVVALSDFSASATIFLLTMLNVTTLSRLRKTMITVVLSIIAVSLAGIAAYHTGFMADRLTLLQQGNEDGSVTSLVRVRYLGFLNDPNDLAQIVVVALPLLALFYDRKKLLRSMAVFLAGSTIFIYTVFLTHSRGAILGIASLFLFGVRKALGTVWTAILLSLMLAGAIGLNVAGGRGFSVQEASAGERVLAWSEGLSMLQERPLFGIGYGDFSDRHHITAHNSFVLCFAELGLIGYFLWLSLIICAFLLVSKATRISEDAGEGINVASILQVSLLGFMTCAYFLSRTFAPPLYLLMALCLAAPVCMNREDLKARTVSLKHLGLYTLCAAVSSIFIVYIMVRMKHAVG